MCENLLYDAVVSCQETIFRKILAKLPAQCFRTVKRLVLQQPLAMGCFDQLKVCFRDRLSLTPSERLRKLEQLPPSIGDMKSSQLYGQLKQLYPNDVDREIVREIFLPTPFTVLCREWLKDHKLAQVAYMADAHFPLQYEYTASTVTAESPLDDVPVPSSMTSWSQQLYVHRGNSQVPRVCDGTLPRSKLTKDLLAASALDTSLTDGAIFINDSGSEVSIPPGQSSRSPLHGASKLKAANGTTIDVFETERYEILDIGLGRTYSFKFVVAAVPNAILGADFLRHHGLIPDLKSARLCDGVTFLKTICSHCCRKAAARLVHVKFEHNSNVPIDGPSFQQVRNLPIFRSLADTPGEFPAVTTPRIDHCIQARGSPVYACPRRLMPAKLDAAETELDELVLRGILIQSQSPWASLIHLVPKDKGNCYRMVGCYERLNAITLPDSKIDLTSAFAQIRVSPQDQQKTAIATPFGLYEYMRMPFRLHNADQIFQRLMDSVFQGLPMVFVYIDDILVLSRSTQEHRADLQAVFKRLQKYRLTVRPDKCVFGKPQIQFLGFHLSDSGLTPLPDKVNDLTNLPPPRNVPDCRRFLGMLNYYHRFIPNFASALLPLHQFANQPKRQPFQWIPAHDAAFQEAKRRLPKQQR
uniref:Reverse transcriptase domain-containing protein n=1 Tax=Trichuris muris TaxID=70415 RepID=A0A5S6QEU5_TRIMR